MEKIVVLGATQNQLPIILKSKERGLYVITIDNIPESVGHIYSDEFVNISIDKREEILEYMISNKIENICSICSDIGIRTYFYIMSKLGKVDLDYNIVDIITTKHKFNKFLRENNIEYRDYIEIDEEIDLEKVNKFIKNGKSIIKPVDSSGSKGIKIVDKKMENSNILEYIENAISISKLKIAVLERYIDGKSVTVNMFIKNGECIFKVVTNKYVDENNEILPIGHSLPSKLSEIELRNLYSKIEKIIEKIKIKDGAFDFDFIICKNKESHCIEMSPRLGGNGLYQLIKFHSGFDEIDEILNMYIEKDKKIKYQFYSKNVIVRLIRSNKSGILKNITEIEKIQGKYKEIAEIKYDIIKGEKVEKFTQGNQRMGHFVLMGECMEKLEEIAGMIEEDLEIKVE